MVPVVSIVIPTYNEEKYIGDTITRLTKQTSWPWAEIIIADYDPDKTGTTINAILKTFDEQTLAKIKHVPIKKSGIGHARHMGCLAAQGRFIVTFDADNRFVQPNAIDHLIRPLLPGYYVVTHCPNVIKAEELYDKKTREANIMYEWRNQLINPISPVLIFESGMTFTKEKYLQVGGFEDTVLGEAPILGVKFVWFFGADRVLQMNNIIVESSGRRAFGSNGGIILDLDYNHAYR